jgi:hypothetical protein
MVVRQRTVTEYFAISLPTKIATHNDSTRPSTAQGEIHKYRHINNDRVEDQRCIISRLTINMREGESPEPGGTGDLRNTERQQMSLCEAAFLP